MKYVITLIVLLHFTLLNCQNIQENKMKKQQIVLKVSSDPVKFSMDASDQEDFSLYFYTENNLIYLKETQETYSGIIVITYPEGNDYAIWNYKNGKIEGTQYFFYKNGEKLGLSNFLNDKAEGEQYNFYKSGKIYNIYTFRNGTINGKTTYYYENGNKEKEGNSRGKNILSEKLTGYWIYYYENGNKKEEGNWSVGGRHGNTNIRVGLWKYYNEQGELIKTIEFDDLGRVKTN